MKKTWIVLLVYLMTGFALFGPFLDDPFLMDDEIQVTHNTHIQNINEWPKYFVSSTMDSGGSAQMGGIYFKPFMTVYFASIWHFFGENSAAFRVPLLLLHVLSALMIFVFLVQFFDWRMAFFAGFAFVIHPINSEIVAYIADAQDALYLFCGLAGLTAFMHIRREGSALTLLAIALLSSLLSKETGALFLVIVPLYAYLFDRPRLKEALAVSFGVGVIYAGLRINSGLLTYEHKVLLIQQATYFERLMTVPLIIWHYIEIFFFPLRISLVTDYAVHSFNFEQFWIPLAGDIIATGLLYGLWKTLRSDVDRRLYLFSMGILAVWFALHGSVILPLDGTFADRWFYLADFAMLILLLLAVRSALARIHRDLRTRAVWVFSAFAFAWIFAATVRTVVRLEDWAVPMALYEREFKQRPFDALMANNVGFELFHRNEIAKAAEYFEIATKNNPVWDVAWSNWGAAEQHLGHNDRALELYKKAVGLGSYYLAYENYAALKCLESVDDECRDFVKRARVIFPLNPKLLQVEQYVQEKSTK